MKKKSILKSLKNLLIVDVQFKAPALKQYNNWAITDKKIFKKIIKLISEIRRTPFEGTGQPKQLKYELRGCWSRRINQEDRLVYEVNDDRIVIISCKGHYLE